MTATQEQNTAERLGLDVKPVPNIFDRALCLKLDMGRFGTNRKLGADQYEVNADKSLTSASKTIVDSKEYDTVASIQTAAAKFVKKQCLPSYFKSGIYLLPIASLGTVDAELKDFQVDMLNAVDAFMAVYPALTKVDQERLRGVFNPADYPPAAKVRSSFFMEWSYISFGVPEALQSVDSELFQREQEKAAQRLTEATNEITQVLRGQMLDLVSHLADKLEGGRGNGKPKIFRDTAVTNIKEFLATFQARNIVDDKQLDVLCSQAKQLLEGVDPQALREQDVVRDRVKKGFDDIKTKLDTMMQDKPGRMIRFAEDEAADTSVVMPLPVVPPPVQGEAEMDELPF